MNKPAHLTSGIAVGLYATKYLPNYLPVLNQYPVLSFGFILLSSMFGSVVLDIDHTKSFIGSKVKPLAWLIRKLFGHRGATHSVVLNILVAVGIYYFGSQSHVEYFEMLMFAITAIMSGYLSGAFSHIFLDMLTKRGVPIFYPLIRYNFKLMFFKTGGIGDSLAVAISLYFIGKFIVEFFTPLTQYTTMLINN